MFKGSCVVSNALQEVAVALLPVCTSVLTEVRESELWLQALLGFNVFVLFYFFLHKKT